MRSAMARSASLSKRESAGAGKWHCSEFAKAHAAAPVASIARKERLRALPLGCFCGGFRLRRECRVAFAVEEERHALAFLVGEACADRLAEIPIFDTLLTLAHCAST